MESHQPRRVAFMLRDRCGHVARDDLAAADSRAAAENFRVDGDAVEAARHPGTIAERPRSRIGRRPAMAAADSGTPDAGPLPRAPARHSGPLDILRILACTPVHSCALLCTPVHSCALLCTPVHSCALLCTP